MPAYRVTVTTDQGKARMVGQYPDTVAAVEAGSDLSEKLWPGASGFVSAIRQADVIQLQQQEAQPA